jgi:hypothetical protein
MTQTITPFAVEDRVQKELSLRRKVLLVEQTRKDKVVVTNEDIRHIKEQINAGYNNKENLALIQERLTEAERVKVT